MKIWLARWMKLPNTTVWKLEIWASLQANATLSWHFLIQKMTDMRPIKVCGDIPVEWQECVQWRYVEECEEVSAIMRVLDLGPIEVSSCSVDFGVHYGCWYGVWGDHVKWMACSSGGIDCFYRILCCPKLDLGEWRNFLASHTWLLFWVFIIFIAIVCHSEEVECNMAISLFH